MMSAPSSDGAAFGQEFAASSGSPDDWSDEALDREAQVEEAPAVPEGETPAATPQQQEEVVAPTSESPAQGEASTETPVTPEPQGGWVGGKYKSPEEMEKGYKNIQRLHAKTQQELQAAELERQQLRAFVEQVQPYLEQLRSNEPGAVDDTDLSMLEPAQLQALINQQVQQQVQQVRAETQAETAQRLMAQTIDQFMASHDDIEPDGELDLAIGELLEEFQKDRQGQRRLDLFPINDTNLNLVYELAKDEPTKEMFLELDLLPLPKNLDIAREAVQNPALAEVLLADPDLVDSERGMNHARKLASLPGMYQQAAAAAAAAQSPEMARRAALVETGGGTPVPTAPGAPQQPDEFDKAIDAWNAGRQSNVFGLQVQD